MASFEEDPDSVVFSDIEPFLINLTVHFCIYISFLAHNLRRFVFRVTSVFGSYIENKNVSFV